MKNNIANKSKTAEETLKEIANSKLVGKCLYCEEIKPICSSHHIPLVFLKSIGDNGYYINADLYKRQPKSTVNKFSVICADCDATLFLQYENPKLYSKKSIPELFADNQTLEQIAVKNYLKIISDVEGQALKRIDEFVVEKYEVAKDHLEIVKNGGTVFQLDALRILDYIVPYVCQDYYVSGNYVCHVCVFPFADFSAVFEFSNYFDKPETHLIEFLDDEFLCEINGAIVSYSFSAYASRTLDVQNLSKNETYPNYLLKKYSLN